MNALLSLREKLKDLYTDYDVYIRPVLRFAMAIVIFLAINSKIGYMTILDNLFVILVLAVICAILPMNSILIVSIVLITAYCFSLRMEVGAFALLLYLMMIVLYFRFVPKDALVIILTPVAFIFHMPVAVPMILGLIRGPVSAVSVVCGVLSWKLVESVPASIEPLVNAKDSSILDLIQAMPKALVSVETILTLITFVVVLLIVAAIRKLISNHSWEIGILVGAVVYFGLTVAGGYILGAQVDLVQEAIGTVLSCLIALILEFFFFSADYSRTEYLQFEDDYNYYYVRVLPKKRPGFRNEYEEDEQDVIPDDDKRFMPLQEDAELERKFDGINLQSKLEESLKNLNTNQTGRENSNAQEQPLDPDGNLNVAQTSRQIAERRNNGGVQPVDESEDPRFMTNPELKLDMAPGAGNPSGGDTKILG
ncbi:MAG: hypothetical protein Q4B22_04645 [Eubacteriales bacterium]|nr:hypothetical protein [Eubacteriales bacterium]